MNAATPTGRAAPRPGRSTAPRRTGRRRLGGLRRDTPPPRSATRATGNRSTNSRAPGIRLARLRDSPTARRAVRGRALALLAAGAVAVVVAASMAHAESERSRWGTTTEVVIAALPLEVGSVLDDTTTRIETRPAALVPEGALGTVPDGRRVAATIAEGEVLVDARVAGPGRGPSGAELGAGDALLAVPLGHAPLGSGGVEPDPIVQVGDRVDLYGTDPADVVGSTSVVARAAVAAAIEPGRVVLRIRRSDAAASAAAVLGGPTTMVVVG